MFWPIPFAVPEVMDGSVRPWRWDMPPASCPAGGQSSRYGLFFVHKLIEADPHRAEGCRVGTEKPLPDRDGDLPGGHFRFEKRAQRIKPDGQLPAHKDDLGVFQLVHVAQCLSEPGREFTDDRGDAGMALPVQFLICLLYTSRCV